MPNPNEVDIKDFEIRATDGLLKGIALRIGKGYEYLRQIIRDSEKKSYYEKFYRYWLAVDAEDSAVADQYFYDFKARRDALRASKSKFHNGELIGKAVMGAAKGIEAAVRKDASAMKKEIPQIIFTFEEILAGAEKEETKMDAQQ